MGTLSSGKLSGTPGWLDFLLSPDIIKRAKIVVKLMKSVKEQWTSTHSPASYKQGFICAEVRASACKNRASCCQNSAEISAKLDEGAADVSETHLKKGNLRECCQMLQLEKRLGFFLSVFFFF